MSSAAVCFLCTVTSSVRFTGRVNPISNWVVKLGKGRVVSEEVLESLGVVGGWRGGGVGDYT